MFMGTDSGGVRHDIDLIQAAQQSAVVRLDPESDVDLDDITEYADDGHTDAAHEGHYADQPAVGLSPDVGFFGGQDWRELDELIAKYSPQGSTQALRNAQQGIHTDPVGADTHVRRYVEAFGIITQEDYDRVWSMYQRTLTTKAASIDRRRYAAIRSAAREGLINNADDLIMREQREAQSKAHNAAYSLWRHVRSVLNLESAHPAATLTQEERDAAVARWKQEDAFEKARREFNERLNNSKSASEKAALRRRYPEFC